jgi:hypothetical protein
MTKRVVPGLVPGINVFILDGSEVSRGWPGQTTSPAMTSVQVRKWFVKIRSGAYGHPTP